MYRCKIWRKGNSLFMMLSQMLCHEHELQKSNFKNHYCEIYHTLQHCHLFPCLSDLPISTPNTHTHRDLDLVSRRGRAGCDSSLHSLQEPNTASSTKQVLRKSESIFIMAFFPKKSSSSLTSWHSCSCVDLSHTD